MSPAPRAVHLRRRLLAGIAFACALAVIGPTVAPAGAADDVDSDPAVVQARQRLAAERAEAAALAAELDEAAAAYERANAHLERLAAEEESRRADARTGQQRADEARDALAMAISASYRQAGAGLALTEALASAPDAATALHRAALLEQVAEAEQQRARRAQQLAERVTDEARQHAVVSAGVAAANAEAAAAAQRLTAALQQAQADAKTAAAAVSSAEAAARERIEEERRRAEEAARAAALARASAGVLPRLDGKVCPIGAPNAFIDSWGFARSGGRSHQGVDMFADYGMPLYAVADGTITKVGTNRLGGLSFHLVDDAGDRYYYAHLSEVYVEVGQRVLAGDVVGANGNSGNARTTPPHLHWQYHPGGGAAVNPYPLAAALCR